MRSVGPGWGEELDGLQGRLASSEFIGSSGQKAPQLKKAVHKPLNVRFLFAKDMPTTCG